MRIVTWTIRLVLFLFLAALAAKNIEPPVTLHFYFERALTAPLIVFLLGAFALGALFGVLALLTTVLRQRREISILRKPPKMPVDAPPAVPPI
jgi:putative membrane protein